MVDRRSGRKAVRDAIVLGTRCISSWQFSNAFKNGDRNDFGSSALSEVPSSRSGLAQCVELNPRTWRGSHT